MTQFSTISFGSYIFPYASVLSSIQQDTQIDNIKIANREGEYAPVGSKKAKIITISGTVGGIGSVDSNSSLIQTMDQAETELQLMASWLEAGYQALNVGYTPARAILAQKQTLKVSPIEGTNRTARTWSLTLYAPDPRWLSTALRTASGTGPGSGTLMNNAGSAVTFPVMTFTGNWLNPSFGIAPVGSGGQYVTVTAALQMGASDTLVIDSNPRNRANSVLYNGQPALNLMGTVGFVNNVGNAEFFPYLQPGTNNVLAVGGTVGSGTYSVSWADAWTL